MNVVSLPDLQILVNELKDSIRKLPNRDNKLYTHFGGKPVSIGVLDGGGVGRFEVLALIDEFQLRVNEIVLQKR